MNQPKKTVTTTTTITPAVNGKRPKRPNRKFANRSRRNQSIPNIIKTQRTGRNVRMRNGKKTQFTNQRVHKSELWFDVIPGTHKYMFKPGSAGVPHLDRIASIYETYCLKSVKLHYKSSSGTQTSGTITAGIDYAPSNSRSAADIKLLDYTASGAIYNNFVLTSKPKLVMKGADWLFTSSAQTDDPKSYCFALYVDVNAPEQAVIGQIWITYDILFSVPTSAIATSANAISVATCNQAGIAHLPVESPDSSVISQAESPPITVENESHVVDASKTNESQIQTDFNLSPELQPSTLFTLGSSETSAPDKKFTRVHSEPKITFKYSDGTPVPPTVIAPQPGPHGVKLLHHPKSVSSIFATIFKILAPLAKPVIASLLESLVPSEEFLAKIKDDPDPTLAVPDTHTAFGFIGDEAQITIPSTRELPLSADNSTNLSMFSAYTVYTTAQGDQSISGRQHYGSFVNSPKNSFLQKYSTTGNVTSITFGSSFDNPVFQTGDLFQIHFSSLSPLANGIGSDGRMASTKWDDSLIKCILNDTQLDGQVTKQISLVSRVDSADPTALGQTAVFRIGGTSNSSYKAITFAINPTVFMYTPNFYFPKTFLKFPIPDGTVKMDDDHDIFVLQANFRLFPTADNGKPGQLTIQSIYNQLLKLAQKDSSLLQLDQALRQIDNVSRTTHQHQDVLDDHETRISTNSEDILDTILDVYNLKLSDSKSLEAFEQAKKALENLEQLQKDYSSHIHSTSLVRHHVHETQFATSQTTPQIYTKNPDKYVEHFNSSPPFRPNPIVVPKDNADIESLSDSDSGYDSDPQA